MDWDLIGILATIAFLAGFFDAIAGGGGLITLPALFLAGIEPISAMATNKFQATSASISATVTFARKGLIEWRKSVFLILFSALGGISGALFVSIISKRVLEACVPILLIIVAVYFIFAPKFSKRSNREKISILLFSFLIAPVLGFYDGIFGPGTGSFLMISFMFFCGLDMMRAMSFTKLANASCNTGALFIFITKGVIIWPLALAMAIASFVGAQLGARCAVKVGPRLIRPMLILVCCVLAIKLISVEDNPLRVTILNLL
ncbi:TSUP family transporter [Photorhabdus temperata]|uniref:Probable membrane transporter protein n=2 Tax=Photorhabdus temperata TaxID=574560 RepID=A0A081S0B2_PHOTE|nr:TSUP family transporter [Photorhabdus temperata]ERT11868.1 membrane protein [Photorhabdus temperata J3]KER04365.1 putative permease [Photorhabdus temperata subsp. temperata Meg1]MCT8348129.1 TSUP family transporter [Photorhabdus temperata]